jgi:inhibitor of cysteine peptidase
MLKRISMLIAMALPLLVVAACQPVMPVENEAGRPVMVETGEVAGPETPVPTEEMNEDVEYSYGEPIVDSVEILVLESFPVQIHAVVRGYLQDGCTELYEVDVEQEEDLFRIDLTTRRQTDLMCTQALVDFEETVPLDVVGLSAGEYRVEANGVTTTFTLDVDNVASE